MLEENEIKKDTWTWVKVKYNNQEIYVAKEYLADKDPGETIELNDNDIIRYVNSTVIGYLDFKENSDISEEMTLQIPRGLYC